MKRRTLFSWLFGGATSSIVKEAAPSVVECDTPNIPYSELTREKREKMEFENDLANRKRIRESAEQRIEWMYSRPAKHGGTEIILKLGVLVLSLLLSGCIPLNWVQPSSHHPAPIEGASDEQPSYYPGSRECGE